MPKYFKQILSFLNLLDRNQTLSITNVALYVTMVKIASVSLVSMADAAVLFLGILNYAHKRHETNKSAKQERAVSELAEVKSQLATIAEKVDGYAEVQGTLEKQAEDIKKLVSNNNLAQGLFGGRK